MLTKWVTASDLKDWAIRNKSDCRQTLPELIRRLIFATASLPKEVDFPSGDSITVGGWDGYLETPIASSPFFPEGISVWEIGTEKRPLQKAEKDYGERLTNPIGVNPAEATFVFVTPHDFSQRRAWVKSKKDSGPWKDVKVIAVDKLEEWLDSAPVVALWLARRIKGLTDNVRDLEYVWEEWSESTEPKMTTDLVIGGRIADAEKIREWITGKPRLLEVRGDSPDEPAAFLYATLAELSEKERVRVFSRCVVVENLQEFRSCVARFQNELVIVGPAECRPAAGHAIGRGHHVFLYANAKSIDQGGSLITLSRPKRNAVKKSLLESGMSEDRAQKFARDFGRSIPVLRRQLALSVSGADAPSWTSAESAQLLIPFLFAGSWDENKEGDCDVVEALSGMKYEVYAKKISDFLSLDDAPIRKIGSAWMLTSPLDAWVLLAPHLDESFLKLFKKSLHSVLTKTDPKYELPPKDRWAAAVYGKTSPYSEWLRSGLVESLVLLAVYGDRSPKVSSTQAFADLVVKEILSTANKWEMWASLKDVTPLLSEASPGVFLETVNQRIEKTPKLFQNLLEDEGGTFGECKHSGLLWALESTAWSPEFITLSSKILAKLAKIDQGGNWSNRPINSLKDIYFPQLPQTYAKPQERLAVLDQLMSTDPKMVWDFTRKYFEPGSMSESYRFRWRYMGGERRGLETESREEYTEYVKGLLERTEKLAYRIENFVSAMDDLIRLPETVAKEFLTALEKISLSKLSKFERESLFQSTRKAIHWISNYDKEGRRSLLPILDRILKKMTPADVLQRAEWLFDGWPDLPQAEPEDYNEKTALIEKAREKVAREIVDKVSPKKIIQFSKKAQFPGIFGRAFGKVVRNGKEDNALVDAALSRPFENVGFIQGYAYERVALAGAGWVEKQFKRLQPKEKGLNEGRVLLYFGLPENSSTWTKVGLLGKRLEKTYWKYASTYLESKSNEEVAIAVEKMLDVKRTGTALSIAGDPKVSISSTLLQRLLQEILSTDEKNQDFRRHQLTEYHLGHVFKQLHERNELSLEELAKLEWPFAKLFRDIKKYVPSSLAIHRLLRQDPSFFAELISFMYKRDDRAPDPTKKKLSKEMAHFRWENAWEVLHSWTLIPGLQDDASLNAEELADWVQSAREKCAETNHITGGDIQIGFMLAHSPTGDDGIWPHQGVRDLLESLNSTIIERHIQTGIYNSRGVVTRGLNEGGQSERSIAENYRKMSEALKIKWPRTSALLKNISESYQSEAKREDLEADLRDFRWD